MLLTLLLCYFVSIRFYLIKLFAEQLERGIRTPVIGHPSTSSIFTTRITGEANLDTWSKSVSLLRARCEEDAPSDWWTHTRASFIYSFY